MQYRQLGAGGPRVGLGARLHGHVGSATLREAAATHPIADLQIEYSLISRGPEDGVLQTANSELESPPMACSRAA